MWEFNAQGVTINLIIIWSYLKLNALSLYYRAFFILPDYYFSQVSVPVASCSHLRFPAISLSLSLTHILPAFPLCPLASPWPPVIQGNWSSHHVITVVVLSQCQAAIMKPDWLQPHPQNWQPGSVAPPPPPPVVSLNSPILLPQNVGATLMSGLHRCLDKLSVSTERFGRRPNVAMGGWRINCNFRDNQNRRADPPSGTGTLSPPFCLSPIIQTLSVKDTHTDRAERLGSKLSRLSADKNMHPAALPCLLLG